jgi:hypothetical protein
MKDGAPIGQNSDLESIQTGTYRRHGLNTQKRLLGLYV